MLSSDSLLNRREILAAAALSPIAFQVGNTAVGAEVGQSQASQRQKIVQWVFDGGLTQEIWDPKPGAPEQVRGELGSLPTSIPGVRFSEVSPELAAHADKCTVVRNVVSPNEFHDQSTRQLLWSQHAFSLSNHGRLLGSGVPVAYVESSFPGKGDGLGWEFNKVRYMNDTVHSTPDRLELAVVDGRVIMPNEEVDTRRLRTRIQLLDVLQKEGAIAGKKVEQADSLRSMAEEILLGKFTDASKLDPRLAARFGKDQLGQAALVAMTLLNAGVGTVDLRTGHWDYHEDIARVMKWRFPDADRALAAQIGHLEETREPVVIAASTEFGRSPVLNAKAGRDHWAKAHSELFYGGKFPRGKIVSATTGTWDRTDAGTPISVVKHIVGRAAGADLTQQQARMTTDVFGS